MAQQRSLEGKVAIVTGGSRGIGAAISANLAAKGCNVAMNYTSTNSASKCEDLASSLSSKHNITAHAIRADLSTTTGPASLMEATLAHFKTKTIHIIINNAGIAGNGALIDTSPEKLVADFDEMYKTNVLGPLLLIQAAIPYLPKDRSGRIVNIASVSASLGFPGQSIYGGTKAALEAMTRTWARELQFQATVNSVNPGPVSTDMYGDAEPWFKDMMRPHCQNSPGMQVSEELDGKDAVVEVHGEDGKSGIGGRAGTPEEIAGVVGMLVSAESQWCTGSVVSCNGGMRMSP